MGAVLALPLLLPKPCLVAQELLAALTLDELAARTLALVKATVAIHNIGGMAELDGNAELLCLGRSSTSEHERSGGEGGNREFGGECFDSSEFHGDPSRLHTSKPAVQGACCAQLSVRGVLWWRLCVDEGIRVEGTDADIEFGRDAGGGPAD